MTEESQEVAEARAKLWVSVPEWVHVETRRAADAVNRDILALIEVVRKNERERADRRVDDLMVDLRCIEAAALIREVGSFGVILGFVERAVNRERMHQREAAPKKERQAS